MRWAILKYELVSWFRIPLLYLLMAIFFLFSAVSILGSGNFFDGTTTLSGATLILNSPYSLALNSFLNTKLLLVAVAICCGMSLTKDFYNNAHSLLFSYPISTFSYLKGKFGSVLVISLFIGLMSVLGIWAGETLLGSDNPHIGSYSLNGYLITVGIYMLPSLLVFAIFIFLAVSVTRQLYAGLVVAFCLFLFPLMLENIFPAGSISLSLLDPFGQQAFHSATADWNFSLKNSSLLPVNQIIICNRVLWIAIATCCYCGYYKYFDFQYQPTLRFKKPANAINKKPDNVPLSSTLSYEPSSVPVAFDLLSNLKSTLYLIAFDTGHILKSWLFALISLFGILTVVLIQIRITTSGNISLLPVTRLMLGAPLSLYVVILTFSTFIFSGALLNRKSQHRMMSFVDSAPVTTRRLIASKLGAIGIIQVLQLLLFFAASVTLQLILGFYSIEFTTYLFHLFILVFPLLFIWNVVSHFTHSLFPNPLISIFALGLLWLATQATEFLGIESSILKFAVFQNPTYSGFYGYSDQMPGLLLVNSVWILFSLVIFTLLKLIWNREYLFTIKDRLSAAKSRLTSTGIFSLILLTGLLVPAGYFISAAETEGSHFTDLESNPIKALEDYKTLWLEFESLPQPKIVDINLKIGLFPDQRRFNASGEYVLKNKVGRLIDTLFVRTGFDEETNLHFPAGAELIKQDDRMKTLLYKLDRPLFPGESIKMQFSIESGENTLFTRHSNVLDNGTFLQEDVLPRLGYPFTETVALPTDPEAGQFNYFHRDADYVSMSTEISTKKGQIALAPGDLIADSLTNGRAKYQYRTPAPVKFNFSFHSADYHITETVHRGIQLRVFHLKEHNFNLPEMMSGLKHALDYCIDTFGVIPHNQVRIIEFPHTAESYPATLKANNIPVSETVFIFRQDREADVINFPFYVVAHEMVHEWFGNQLMPADAEGAKLLTESVAEYLTLRIYERAFGKEALSPIFKMHRQRYLSGKRNDPDTEPPLVNVLNHQDYLSYGKGALALFAISEAVGKDELDSVLSEFFKRFRAIPNAYPTSVDFLTLIKEQTDPHHHPEIEMWLKDTGLPDYQQLQTN